MELNSKGDQVIFSCVHNEAFKLYKITNTFEDCVYENNGEVVLMKYHEKKRLLFCSEDGGILKIYRFNQDYSLELIKTK